jgi:undecaprenyl-diphosphatase
VNPSGDLAAAVLLGVVQGLTEFLPVSSSAHLLLAREALGFDAERFGLSFDVACHVGTLVAVLLYFRRELTRMARAVPSVFGGQPDADARRVRLVALGTIPVVAFGLTAGDVIEAELRAPAVAASMLAVVAVVMLAVERLGRFGRSEMSIGHGEAVVIGCAQAAALVPGVSRSGATITTGMALGLRREEAARFSFLLGVPAILAAALREGLALALRGVGPGEWPLFVTGIFVSGAVGYLAIAALLRFLVGHSLAVFAWYRLGVAAAFALWWWVR